LLSETSCFSLETERLRDQDSATNDVETVEDKVSAGQSERLAIRHTNTAANTERGRPGVTYMERDEDTSREPAKIESHRFSLKDVGSANSVT
jgi:hypothetical protein